jgi:hypothetical protein
MRIRPLKKLTVERQEGFSPEPHAGLADTAKKMQKCKKCEFRQGWQIANKKWENVKENFQKLRNNSRNMF